MLISIQKADKSNEGLPATLSIAPPRRKSRYLVAGTGEDKGRSAEITSLSTHFLKVR
jgi:hypothetical protein